MAKRGQPFNIAFPRGCNEKQRWLNFLDLAVCALLRSARRSPIQIFDDQVAGNAKSVPFSLSQSRNLLPYPFACRRAVAKNASNEIAVNGGFGEPEA
jgi:hypothetical protein